MSTFSIGERVKCDNREGIVLGMHSADGELFKVWFDEFGDWKYMLESELASIDECSAERDALAAEVERLRAALETEEPTLWYTVSVILPMGQPSTMPSKGINDKDAIEYARLKIEKDYVDYPVKIVGISRVITE